jgi:hypothetical protein
VETSLLGFDTHSVTADPLFVDAAAGDYRLQPASEAFRLGIQPLAFEEIGLRRLRDSPAHHLASKLQRLLEVVRHGEHGEQAAVPALESYRPASLRFG